MVDVGDDGEVSDALGWRRHSLTGAESLEAMLAVARRIPR
jgi:hypothetical protein